MQNYTILLILNTDFSSQILPDILVKIFFKCGNTQGFLKGALEYQLNSETTKQKQTYN